MGNRLTDWLRQAEHAIRRAEEILAVCRRRIG